ncbi:hypothetical protein FRC04_004700 [Tulasnella sp. 424]|nr:hypothetical protein FRC04_004700 [Tulasnella sp. 424]KAG8963802.1 hypothetical protein FRC05_004512 [Tulasnella sp. 425]
MKSIIVGDTVPAGQFKNIQWGPELEDKLACGVPRELTTDAFKGKKVVIVSVPGAFTPTCHVNHLPPYLAKYEEFKAKGVDDIYVLAANDVFVMSGWATAQGLKDKIVAISDTYAKWSESMGLSVDLTAMGMGVRTARYVLILDDLKVVSLEARVPGTYYIERSLTRYDDLLQKEPGRGLTNTDADTTLSKL